MAKIFEMHGFSERDSPQASSKKEPNSSDSGRMAKNDLLSIDMPKQVSGRSWRGLRSHISMNAEARLLLVIGVVCGLLYFSVSGKKSAVANPKQDAQRQTRATVQPAQPGRPLSKPSPIIPVATAPVESSIVPQKASDPARHSPASWAPLYPSIRYEATRKKVFGGCTGQLELTRSRLQFRCPNEADLVFPVTAIAKAHKDGVVLKSGEKYHFTISNHTRGQAEAIFISWLNKVQQVP